MGRGQSEALCSKNDAAAGNERLALALVCELVKAGVTSCSLAPGVRNSAFIAAVEQLSPFSYTMWNDERSAAFFALGQSRRRGEAAAVCSTSGSAAGELLPAAMEAYYSGLPLVLITADRPRRFRGSGAPQCVEQVGLFGPYAPFSIDVAAGEPFSLEGWDRRAPAHLNICFEEAYSHLYTHLPDLFPPMAAAPPLCYDKEQGEGRLSAFIESCRCPIAIVGELRSDEREPVAAFLRKMALPVYLEATSGLRENPLLEPFRIFSEKGLLSNAASCRYPIDGVLRLGGVPTLRFWRDLEEMEGKIAKLSISRLPFGGLSWGEHLQLDLASFLPQMEFPPFAGYGEWLEGEKNWHNKLELAPQSEEALVRRLSCVLPADALLFLGNSMPIREWNQYASFAGNERLIFASRGVNGIDGQLSTFYGAALEERENWALIGDLTALYDLSGPWVLPQLGAIRTRLVVINNCGSRIFEQLFKEFDLMHNSHQRSFSPVAELWGMEYHRWEEVPDPLPPLGQHCLIELCPTV